MSEEVVGKVVSVTSDQYARFIVVEHVTSNNYTRRIACRFQGDKRTQQIVGVDVGDEVKIIGGAESREGKDKFAGRWFTNFECFKCTKLKGVEHKDPEAPPADDGDEIPF